MIERIKGFFAGVKTEFKKVAWPTKKETTKYTIVVLTMATILTVFLGAVNTGIIQVIQLSLN